MSQAQTCDVSKQEHNDSQLKIKTQRAQLTYMINENENLKSEVDHLRSQLELAQTALSEKKSPQKSLTEQNR